MTFGTFLLYFIASHLVFNITGILFVVAIKKYQYWNLERKIKSGEIKMLQIEDVLGHMEDPGDKKWN